MKITLVILLFLTIIGILYGVWYKKGTTLLKDPTFKEVFVKEKESSIKACMTTGATPSFCECTADYLMKDVYTVQDIQEFDTGSLDRLNKFADEAALYCREG